MKNIQAVISKADIHDYAMALWKTDLFRDSHKTGGFVHKIVEEFAWLPRLFCEMSSDHLERSHFATWWNVLTTRDDYTNPYIHDLYWIHEFYHAAHMPYVPHIGKAAFDEKMQRNELEASVFSEIQAYFEMPELRKLSFDHPIYADRFLNDPAMHVLWKANPAVTIEKLRTIRRDVMVSKSDRQMDETEKWIRRFSEQNVSYSIIWSDRYREVEDHMAAFQIVAAANRITAIREHLDWITEEAEGDATDNVPFRHEAELFAAAYWANKQKYQKAMISA